MSYIVLLTIAFIGATYSVVIAVHVAINCIPLVKCPQLLNLIETDRDSLQTIRILRSSHCGYNENGPKVWCIEVYPVCKTPNGKSGKCIDVTKCEILQNLMTNQNELGGINTYIKNAKCKGLHSDNSKETICCPPDSNIHVFTLPNTLPDQEKGECGHQITSKIFGGQSTELGEFPWAALIQYEWKSVYSTNCGGTLISSRYVVTAAHCVDSSAIRSVGNIVNVILGEYDTRNDTDCVHFNRITSCADPRLIVPVQETVIHPDWNKKPSATIDGDIALIRLSLEVTFSDYVRPICLPSSSTVLKDRTQLVVTGWGQTETEDASFVKLKTSLPLANKVECINRYKNDKRLSVGDAMICVGGEAGKDSCSGDSGGPLMYPSQNNDGVTWFLAGVVSFGPNQPCGIKNYPGLYTYLPKYVDWIRETIRT